MLIIHPPPSLPRYCALTSDWYAYSSDLYCNYKAILPPAEFDALVIKGRYGNVGAPSPVPASPCSNSSAAVYNNLRFGHSVLEDDTSLSILAPRISSIEAFRDTSSSISIDSIVWTDDALYKWRIGLNNMFWENIAR
jgi:hypothetical protein